MGLCVFNLGEAMPCFSYFKDILFDLSPLRLSKSLLLTEVKEQVNTLLYMKNDCFILEIDEIIGEISRAKS